MPGREEHESPSAGLALRAATRSQAATWSEFSHRFSLRVDKVLGGERIGVVQLKPLSSAVGSLTDNLFSMQQGTWGQRGDGFIFVLSVQNAVRSRMDAANLGIHFLNMLCTGDAFPLPLFFYIQFQPSLFSLSLRNREELKWEMGLAKEL